MPHRPARGQGPSDPAADAVSDRRQRLTDDDLQVDLRVPAVDAAGAQPRAAARRPAGGAAVPMQPRAVLRRAGSRCVAAGTAGRAAARPLNVRASAARLSPDRAVRARQSGVDRPTQPPLLAAVSAVDRRRREAPLGASARTGRRSTRATWTRWDVPGRHALLEGVRLRRPQGRDADDLDGARRTRWAFASYAWNDDGTDAVLAPPDGVARVTEVAPGQVARHSRRSTDCHACHESGRTELARLQRAAAVRRPRSARAARRAAPRRRW